MRTPLLALLFLLIATPLTLADSTLSRKVIDMVAPSIVMVTSDRADGTGICAGFVVNAFMRQVLTAAHCILDGNERAKDLRIDGKTAAVIKVDDWLALLTSPSMDKPSATINSKDLLALGDTTYAFGFAMGVPTLMIRPILWIFNERGMNQMRIILDGPYLNGMSGGPVVDEKGRVIGVVQMSDERMGMASGPATIKAFLK